VSASADLDMVVEESHRAVGEFAKGNPEPLKLLFSRREDATLANPFGPPVRGFDQAAATMDRAASFYRDGEVVGFERVAMNVTPELAYIVEIEKFQAKMGGSDKVTPVSLRVTSIYRPEEGTWKIVHRHADAITTAQAPESVIQR
jgi:ketosteroid isomerase-like protein